MKHNGVWDLVKLSKDCKRVDCKWVFKTKHDSHGNLECYKARLVAKRFTQKDDIERHLHQSHERILSRLSWY